MTQPAPEEHTVAHRPRSVSRVRLLPLAMLCLCVIAAMVVGAVHGGPVTSGAPAAASPDDRVKGSKVRTAQEKAQQKAQQRAARCTPKWSSGIRSEPWQGKRRPTSERTFRKQIAKENPAYVRGKDGWLFFTDYQSNNFSQGLGRSIQTKAEREAWAKFFKKSQRTVERAGAVFYIVVSPATWEVYPKKLPEWAQRLRGTPSLERLMKANPKLPWIDTRPALKKAARKHATYEPLNSHWTPYGGYVAWDAITKCLRAKPGLEGLGVPALARVGVEPNLNEFAGNGVPDGKPARTVPVYQESQPPTEVTTLLDGATLPNVPDHSVDAIHLPVRTTTPAAQTDKTLLVYRDSTGSALSPLWSRSFATTIQYHHGVASTARPTEVRKTVRKFHPDVFLYVITERFLDSPPPRG